MSGSDPASTSAWLYVLLLALILATAGLLVVVVHVLLLILAGLLFGLFLNGLSQFLARYLPLGYRGCYLVVLLGFVALAVGGLYWSGSQIARQVSTLTTRIESAAEQVGGYLEGSAWAPYYYGFLSQVEYLISEREGILPQIMTVAGSLVWGATAAFVILFVGLYVAYDPHLYEQGILKLVPPDQRDRAAAVLRTVRATLGWWIVGRLMSMGIVGLATSAALWWLGVPLPLTLGVIAALLTFIPNIGPVVAAVPQALLAFGVSPSTVLYVLLFNLALQSVESYLITPLVQQYEVSLPPALTVFAQLLMAVLVGVIGIVMAAPLAAVVMVLVQALYIHDRLGDPNPGQFARQC